MNRLFLSLESTRHSILAGIKAPSFGVCFVLIFDVLIQARLAILRAGSPFTGAQNVRHDLNSRARE